MKILEIGMHKDSATRWMGVWTVGLFVLALRPIESFDTFWQLQTGKYIWQTKAFMCRDVFSIASDVFRLEHCWLHDLVLYALYTLGGYPLLTLLKPAVIVLGGALLLRWGMRRGVEPAIAVPVLILCLMASAPSWLVRPQLWTFLFSLLYLHLLHAGRQKGLRAWLWLAPIMLFWANLHGGCVFGLVLIGLFGLAELVRIFKRETSWAAWGKLVGAGLLTLGATFVNPYGYRIPMILLGNISLHKVATGEAAPTYLGVMEWLPPTFAQVPLFYVVMGLWGILLLCRLRRLDPAEGIYFLAFLYMGFSQIRHTTLVALLAGYYLPSAVQDVALPLWRKFFPRFPLLGVCRWGAGLLMAGLILFQGATGRLGWGLKDHRFPEDAADFLLRHRPPGNLYNAYDWGGYLMWRLFPDYLVFVDGRSDSQETFHASSQIDNLWQGWEVALDRFGINTVITRTCYDDTGGPVPLVTGLVGKPDWALVYGDGTALIFVRKEEASRVLWESFSLPSFRAYETMLDEARRLYEEDHSRNRAFLAMGRAALKLGRYPEALDSFRRYLEKEPDNREASTMVNFLQMRLRGND